MVELLDNFAKEGVVLWGEGGRLRFRASKGALTESMRSRLASGKDSILAAWRTQAARDVVSHPAAHGQRALWFVHQSNPASPAYNVVFSVRIHSIIDLPALHRSFQALVDRHSSLRTCFREEASGLVQRVHGYMPVCFHVHERLGLDMTALQKEVRETSQIPFNLETGPMIRVDLFSRGADDHVLLLTIHHIAVDGWSIFLLLEDLLRIYPAERGSNAAPPPRPVHDILDHARWQATMLASPQGQAHKGYWLNRFQDAIAPLNMPTDRPRVTAPAGRGLSLPINLGRNLSDAVHAFAAREGTTPFVLLLTIYQILLHRYTGQQEIIVGSPTYGRDNADFSNLVGCLINMIALKASFQDDPPFRQLLAQIRQTVLEGIDHQNYPFPLLVENLHPDRDFSRTPVFQTVFTLQKFSKVAALENLFGEAESNTSSDFAGLQLEPFPIAQQEGQFELSMDMADHHGTLKGVLKYDSDLFDLPTAQQLIDSYETLLRSALASPETPVSRLPLVDRATRERLIHGSNTTDRRFALERTVIERFGEQVIWRPDAVALSFEGQKLTYAELDRRSTRLARHLQSLGVTCESLVGICLERGIEMVIGVLAVLKSGGSYLPLDPDFPTGRLRYMIEDSEAKVLISRSVLAERFFSGLNRVHVLLDQHRDQIECQRSDPLPRIARPENRAYVLYTSGSTGRPKGVEIEHRALTNFLCSMAREPGIDETDVLLAVTTLSFDIAGLELFLPLISGARIELAGRSTTLDGTALTRTLTNSGATIMQATPATWRLLFESGWKGDRRLKALCGGEAMDPTLAKRLVQACSSVWNMYGPTETTIWSSIASIQSEKVTIGRPIANTQMYILDGHKEPVPRGVSGELWIGGEGVARGYLGQPDLTKERFVEDPFHPGARMYRTGDLARRLEDGQVDCLGRVDDQIKVRGYRIELGEIESVLASNPMVGDCAAAVRTANGDDARIVAYIVPATANGPTVEELKVYLRTTLPEYMVPSTYMFLSAIPRTPNRKVDRNALPVPSIESSGAVSAFVSPRSRVEQIMAEIWAEVLGLEKVGVFDHFFELGGHSLSAARLIARLKEAFRIDIPLRSIFIEPTIAGMAKQVLYDDVTNGYYHAGEIRRWNRLVPAQPKGSRIPFFLVAGFMDVDDTLRVLSRLIPHLGLDQPVYGFQPRWLDGHSERYSSAREAALEFLSDLRTVQPKGPYLLGGDCAGGVVAMVMAEELLQQGEEVRLLVMFDTHRPTTVRSIALQLYNGFRRLRHISGLVQQIAGADGQARIELLRELARRKFGSRRRSTPKHKNGVEKLNGAGHLNGAQQNGAQHLNGAESPNSRETIAVERVYRMRMDYMRTMYGHRLKKYPGKITLIVNEQYCKYDKSMGWTGYASEGLEIHSTPGDHWTRYLHGAEFSKRLQGCLQRAQNGHDN